MRLEEALRSAAWPCPNCTQQVRGDLHALIDAQASPDLAAAARSGDLNSLLCPACGQRFVPPTPLLYWDSAERVGIALAPPALGTAEDQVNALLSAWLTDHPADDLDDRLLMPVVVPTAQALADELAQSSEKEWGVDLGVVVSFASQHDAQPVLELLDLMDDVTSIDTFVAVMNDHPRLLTPDTYRATLELAEAASEEGLDEVAMVLSDLASLLLLHLPRDVDDNEGLLREDDHDLEQLLAAELDSAEASADPPRQRRAEEARRALQTVNREEAERREGFVEHARLFGALLEDTLQPETPDRLPENDELIVPPAPAGVAEEAWQALLTAFTSDLVDEALSKWPELVDPGVREAIGELQANAADAGHDALVAHLQMLITTLLVASGDEDDEGDDES